MNFTQLEYEGIDIEEPWTLSQYNVHYNGSLDPFFIIYRRR
jgi:hypothetical protein